MRHQLLTLTFLAGLSACEPGIVAEPSDEIAQLEAEVENSFLYLKCDGEYRDPFGLVEAQSRDLAINSADDGSSIIYQFIEFDQMYKDMCSTKLFNCDVSVDDTLIQGFGSDTEDGLDFYRQVSINRMTGRIYEMTSLDGNKSIFEGQCERSEPPEVGTPKF